MGLSLCWRNHIFIITIFIIIIRMIKSLKSRRKRWSLCRIQGLSLCWRNHIFKIIIRRKWGSLPRRKSSFLHWSNSLLSDPWILSLLQLSRSPSTLRSTRSPSTLRLHQWCGVHHGANYGHRHGLDKYIHLSAAVINVKTFIQLTAKKADLVPSRISSQGYEIGPVCIYVCIC